jgi:hypothetical protein
VMPQLAEFLAIAVGCFLASILATFVLLFAVQPSIAQTHEGTSSVGFVHKALASTLPTPLVNGLDGPVFRRSPYRRMSLAVVSQERS